MRRMMLGLILLYATLIFAAPAQAQVDPQGGGIAYRNHFYGKTYKQLLPLADAGDPLAQYYIGEMYYKGQGRQADEDAGLRYLRAAADQGLAEAQYALGEHYIGALKFEEPDPRDTEQAHQWLLKSAKQGYPDAYNLLSISYCLGRGVPEIPLVSAAWFSLFLEAVLEQPWDLLLIDHDLSTNCDHMGFDELLPAMAAITAEKLREVHDLPSAEESRARFGD